MKTFPGALMIFLIAISLGAAPELAEQRKANVEKLASDLAQIKQGSPATSEQKQKVVEDLKMLAGETNKVSTENLILLANDLAKGISEKSLEKTERAKLATNIQIIFDCGNSSQSEASVAIKNADAILNSNFSKADAQQISNDLKAIATQLQKSGAIIPPNRPLPKKDSGRRLF